ncbi:hypothetical protein DFH08DRAFT_1088565 [Mycena albidolilacea]|uniref:DUF6532 domain-containing protein n=1 Tax=Mycena albidolilacea TaxID=1033008 RepID=A0AAD7EBD8_9AGAR|nr:hypothetical protein DFH08DRAFT_1088565 [Mycena albidolilacea]
MPPRTSKEKPSVAKKAKQSELEKLIAQQKKTEKLLAEANTKFLAKRNADMLDEEEEAAPAKKKAKSSKSNSSAPASDSFGEDDAAALDGLLGSNRVGAADETDKDSDDGSASDSGGVSLNNGEDMDDDEEDEEDDELPSIDSDMVIEDPIKKGAQRHTKKTGSSRVTQSTFTPTSVRLANVGRQAVRVEIATKEGFPLNHAGFALEAMSNVVAALDSPELVERLAMATDERRSQLIAYAWGGAPQVRGEVKTLCNGAVGLFGIPGDLTPEQIETHIKWLTGKTSIFKFGGIDLETQTYDVQQPYGAPFYKDVMTKQWFDSAKSEGVRAASFQRFIDSPVPVLTLITDGNSLKEWAIGVRIKIKFTEEEFGQGTSIIELHCSICRPTPLLGSRSSSGTSTPRSLQRRTSPISSLLPTTLRRTSSEVWTSRLWKLAPPPKRLPLNNSSLHDLHSLCSADDEPYSYRMFIILSTLAFLLFKIISNFNSDLSIQ